MYKAYRTCDHCKRTKPDTVVVYDLKDFDHDGTLGGDQFLVCSHCYITHFEDYWRKWMGDYWQTWREEHGHTNE